MKDKIIHLMKSESLTTTRLAEILEIQPSAVSHLVSGRNKPGFDLIQKILRKFPQINPDWLLLDSEKPYRSTQVGEQQLLGGDLVASDANQAATELISGVAQSPQGMAQKMVESLVNSKNGGVRSPTFVLLFFDDGSCESYSMRR